MIDFVPDLRYKLKFSKIGYNDNKLRYGMTRKLSQLFLILVIKC